jgi:hypothetical protein
VYLDQADWSYLADNRSPEAARILRRLAVNGAVTLLLSEIHLIETHALGAGFVRRADFIASFPNTSLIQHSPVTILRAAGDELSARALGETVEQTAFGIAPVDRTSFDSISFEAAQRAFEIAAMFERTPRALAPDTARASKLAAALIRGKSRDTNRLLDDIHLNSAARFIAHRVVGPVLRTVAGFAEANGYLAPVRRRLDHEFTACFLTQLPIEKRRSPHALNRIYNEWKRNPEVTPSSLRCYAAVWREQQAARSRIARSEILDRWHSAFAPLVDVFTCDKRNHRAVRDALSGRSSTRVIRTNRLDDVVSAIESILAVSLR